MSALAVLVLAPVAGGLGAAVRVGLEALLRARRPGPGKGAGEGAGGFTPSPITVINALACLTLGLLVGLSGPREAHPVVTVLGGGLLGGFSTFSSAVLPAAAHLRASRVTAAVRAVVGPLLLCVGAALLGLLAGSLAAR